MGNLTRDAELRKKGDATSVLTFGLAINEKKKDSETGEYVDAPVFVDCALFGARAEALAPYLTKGKKVSVDGRFESQARAAKAVGVPREAIYAALRGHIATKGLHFYYADEPKPDEEFFRNRSWTRVRCKETGVVYESIAQAARETGVSEKNIQSAAKRHGTAKGLHFYYADEPEPDDLLPSKRGIRVRCVETGVVYKTITQAAKETGASQAGIRGAASGMAGGFRWEYVDD